MKTEINVERSYTINYYRPGTKDAYGVSISVVGDNKTKVMQEAKDMLERGIKDANAIKQENDNA